MAGVLPSSVDAAQMKRVSEDPAFRALTEALRLQSDRLDRANNAPQSDANRMSEILSALDAWRTASQQLSARISELNQAVSSIQQQQNAPQQEQQQQPQGRSSNGVQSQSPSQTSSIASSVSTSVGITDSGAPTSGATSPTRLGQLLKNPQRLQAALEFVELMMDAQILVTMPNSTRGIASLAVSAQNVVFPIPLKLATPISDASVTTASAIAQLNSLLAALRKTGQLPS